MNQPNIPVLRLGPLLMASIQVELTDALAEQLQEDLLTKIQETQAEAVLLDITALDIVDTFISRLLSETADMCRLMDCKLMLVGIQPAVTVTLMQMGLALTGIMSAMDMQTGLYRLGYQLTRISSNPSSES
ncbi:MAG: STAS domain-containing protein [Deltaproteobacteria bacterium]|nr:MAG: STAS domain-containing protein [Deltaproteobacteria bacterium]